MDELQLQDCREGFLWRCVLRGGVARVGGFDDGLNSQPFLVCLGIVLLVSHGVEQMGLVVWAVFCLSSNHVHEALCHFIGRCMISGCAALALGIFNEVMAELRRDD